MSLEKFRDDMDVCNRCSACKFIPLEQIKGYDRVQCCPSIKKYNFNAYSGGGRLNIAMALLDGRLEPTDKIAKIIYNCQMCGACDVSCKYGLDMEVMDPLYELRFHCVEQGVRNKALDETEDYFCRTGFVSPPHKKDFDGLTCKKFPEEQASVLYFPGCRTTRDVARSAVELLTAGGVDVAVSTGEMCCGGRIYEMGYRDAFVYHIAALTEKLNASGVETVVTSCAECFYTLSVLIPKLGLERKFRVKHITTVLDELISSGKLEPKGAGPIKVTYHDPCHLGRKGEPYTPWEGVQRPGHMRVYDPPKEFRRGEFGIYDAPRRILSSIPSVTLVEMERIKEYAWCCGAGGGVKESNPSFALETAEDRMQEAKDTGAEYIVTACPGCVDNFKDCTSDIKVIDIIELLAMTL